MTCFPSRWIFSRPARHPDRRDGRATDREGRLRGGEQPACHPGHRRASAGPRHQLSARLRRQRRRHHQRRGRDTPPRRKLSPRTACRHRRAHPPHPGAEPKQRQDHHRGRKRHGCGYSGTGVLPPGPGLILGTAGPAPSPESWGVVPPLLSTPEVFAAAGRIAEFSPDRDPVVAGPAFAHLPRLARNQRLDLGSVLGIRGSTDPVAQGSSGPS